MQSIKNEILHLIFINLGVEDLEDKMFNQDQSRQLWRKWSISNVKKSLQVDFLPLKNLCSKLPVNCGSVMCRPVRSAYQFETSHEVIIRRGKSGGMISASDFAARAEAQQERKSICGGRSIMKFAALITTYNFFVLLNTKKLAVMNGKNLRSQ